MTGRCAWPAQGVHRWLQQPWTMRSVSLTLHTCQTAAEAPHGRAGVEFQQHVPQLHTDGLHVDGAAEIRTVVAVEDAVGNQDHA